MRRERKKVPTGAGAGLCCHLENGNLVAQLTFLLGGEAQFINDLHCHIPAGLPVLSWVTEVGEKG